ncbi:ABC transporter ATP-binding protein [Conexibacter arvalis]|uniref:NitT/TauT family transport system ATP-binding protein n=1 Tax=Conexibacter arvalis TaxID=912552 RepID=A0A840ICR3_9ACTN|nr:ABC transporter ATP-binding protein [Conexibacter arvalis]MBB4661838.1 NitT/TauT family transport system ATP-binding protein [Conexibacter arvalis]
MTEAATAPHDHGPVQARPTAVAVRGVSKTFGNGASAVTALDDVSFDVPQGSFLSVLGPSGCGKSTLMRLVAGLQPASTGTIEVAGGTPDEMRRAREFGIVFQQPVLFDWRTVEQNVGLPLQIMGRPKGEARERVEHMLELVGLSDFRKHRPWQLSGGMQQRVSIARALTFAPPFLLMDEPFGALDMMTRERMQTELLSIWASNPGTTVIFITHSISEAVLLSDRIVVMSARPGRVLKVIDVDLPRPRTDETRDSKEFVDVEAEIRQLIFSQEGR